MKNLTLLSVALLALTTMGCSTHEIPPAHKGRLFDKTGFLAAYSGGNGFEGPILGPGTVRTGPYPEVRMIECAQKTQKQPMLALTKDGVQFSLELFVTFSANCDENAAIENLFAKISPEGNSLTVTANQVYVSYVYPALGESVRIAVSPYIANEINEKRDEIFKRFSESFAETMKKQTPKVVNITSLTLNNLDFPDAMDKANVERATQAILKDKAIAEREKIQEEIKTSKLEVQSKTAKADAEAAEINIVGKALHDNPEYFMREYIYYAAKDGNAVMVPANPNVIMQMTPKKGKLAPWDASLQSWCSVSRSSSRWSGSSPSSSRPSKKTGSTSESASRPAWGTPSVLAGTRSWTSSLLFTVTRSQRT